MQDVNAQSVIEYLAALQGHHAGFERAKFRIIVVRLFRKSLGNLKKMGVLLLMHSGAFQQQAASIVKYPFFLTRISTYRT
jgi:hypothetical protein